MNHQIIDITNPSNRSMKEWRSLLTGKGIRKTGKALISGEKLIHEIAEYKIASIRDCILSRSMAEPQMTLSSEIPFFRLTRELFNELDVFGTDYPLLVVDIPPGKPLTELPRDDNCVLLIPFQDPSNVGAAVRSAAAFGVTSVVLLAGAAVPFHPKSIRASGAQVLSVNFFDGPSMENLDTFPYPIVALSRDGENLYEFRFPEQFALLPGIEGPGLPDDVPFSFRVSIPMEPHVESLNAAVAVSIALYEWRRVNSDNTPGNK